MSCNSQRKSNIVTTKEIKSFKDIKEPWSSDKKMKISLKSPVYPLYDSSNPFAVTSYLILSFGCL